MQRNTSGYSTTTENLHHQPLTHCVDVNVHPIHWRQWVECLHERLCSRNPVLSTRHPHNTTVPSIQWSLPLTPNSAKDQCIPQTYPITNPKLESCRTTNLNSSMQNNVVTETQLSLFTHSLTLSLSPTQTHSRVSMPVINWD